MILGLFDSNVEDIVLSVGDEEQKVVATELVGQERWVKVKRPYNISGLMEALVTLKFGRRESREVTSLMEELPGGDLGGENMAEVRSIGSTDDGEEDI